MTTTEVPADLLALPELELSESGRTYVYDDQEFVRVTDVIHKTLPPYLAPWAEEVGHKAALTIYERDGVLPSSVTELRQLVREAGLTCDDEKQSGANRGSSLHLAIEAMIRTGEAISVGDFEDPEHVKYAQSFAQFMLDYQPIFEEAEIRVVHPELGYAGTFDAIGRVTAKPKGARGVDLTGKRIVFDFKTNKKKSVYEQHLYQLAAYELALEHWGIDVGGSAVVALGPMGDIKGKPYTFRGNYVERSSFAQLIATHRMLQEQKKRNPLGRSK
jgi:hypothetical protein